MEQTDEMKEVYFDKYCATCANKDIAESEEPCYECLSEPAREYSHKPLNWKSNVAEGQRMKI